MKDFLAGCFSIRIEKVDPFTSKTRKTQPCGKSLSQCCHRCKRLGWKVGKIRDVASGSDEQVTFVHGVDVEKSNQEGILVNHARVSGAGSDSTEHAGRTARVSHLRTNPPTPRPS